MKIAVQGGSFDPPHLAHQMAALYLLSAGGFDQVWMVPVYSHPFDKRLTPFETRVEMCEATAEVFGGRVRVMRSESLFDGTSYTLRLLMHLRDSYPGHEFHLVAGSDILKDRPAWHRFDLVERLAPPVYLGRAGYPSSVPVPVELPAISSTDVRTAVARGELNRTLVPRPVRTIIGRDGLYR